MNACWILTKHCDARTATAAIALLMLAANTEAADLSLQLETGAVAMTHQMDDEYVEYGLPGHPYHFSYNTVAFGAGARLSFAHAQVTIGWRNLGTEHLTADVIDDGDYWHCKRAHTPCQAPSERWLSTGNEQQFYAELGYAFHLSGGFSLIPSVGIAEQRITWHTQVYLLDHMRWGIQYQSQPQLHPSPFAGLTVAKGPVGVGVFMLNTKPMHDVGVDPYCPGQGSSALYARITYSIGQT